MAGTAETRRRSSIANSSPPSSRTDEPGPSTPLLSTSAPDWQKDGHFSLLRSLLLADYVTELNGLSGIAAIFSCLQFCAEQPAVWSRLYWTIGFIFLGLCFDVCDGKIARGLKQASKLGQQLDSLADLITFGVAPATLAYCIGFRSLVDRSMLIFFVLCGLTRLARFNVTAAEAKTGPFEGVKEFEGTPIPSSLALVVVMGSLIYTGSTMDSLPGGVLLAGSAVEFHAGVVVFAIHGCLMVSRTIKIKKR